MEVWCWFRDKDNPINDIAIRQRDSIGRVEILNTDSVRLRVGPSGYGHNEVWGEVKNGDQRVQWHWTVDHHNAMAIERVAGMGQYDFFPRFQSNGARHWITGTVTVNGVTYKLDRQVASDGHYWNTQNLKAWSWGHCSSFAGDDDCLFDGIAARLNDWAQPAAWFTFRYKGVTYTSSVVEAFYFNRELDADLTSWNIVAERGDIRFVATLHAKPDEQILIVHPLPDDEYLYQHTTYTGDMQIDIDTREGSRWWKVDSRIAKGSAGFEVARKTCNPQVKREFAIVRER